MSRGYSEEIIQKIRKKVIDGNSKYAVAKEMGISPEVAYKYTKDLPNKFNRQPSISGKPLQLLKELLEKGFVYTRENRNALRSLQSQIGLSVGGESGINSSSSPVIKDTIFLIAFNLINNILTLERLNPSDT